MNDDRADYSKIRITASKAIRLKCLDCCCWQLAEVVACHIVRCPLWSYRLGKETRYENVNTSTKCNPQSIGAGRGRK
jgi:hypothetical protein